MALTAVEKKLVGAVGFDEGVCKLLKQESGGSLTRLIRFTEQFDPVEAEGLAVKVPRAEAARIVARLQPQLLPRGYRLFWTGHYNRKGNGDGDAVALLKTTDETEIIRLRRSNGGNYGVSTGDILRALQSWRSRCEFEIVGADGDWVAIQFLTLPERVCEFAEEIYELCADTVEQGVGLRNESDYPKEFAAARRLCPELTEKMERKLQSKQAEIEAMKKNVPPQVRAMLDSSGFTTPTDMGIRLLAYQLKQSKQLYLWWD